MDRLRTRTAHLMLALGLVLWVVGSAANRVHDYLVVHVVCPEHGELVELSHDEGAVVASAGPSVGDDVADDDHDHGCATLLTSWAGVPSVPPPTPPLRVKTHRAEKLWATAAPRGPPLDFAPKTSPPLAS